MADIERESFAVFPRELGDWQQRGGPQTLEDSVAEVLGADDYRSVRFVKEGEASSVEFFSAWYDDQSKGGVHSPEICLPGGGWEIAWLERVDIADELGFDRQFELNRAIIQKGQLRMVVYYYFDQKGRKIAWDFAAKFYLLMDGITTGRTDGALVRLTTVIGPDESDAQAEERLKEMLMESVQVLPRFIPET